MALIYFYGVSVSQDRRSGYIESGELIKNFSSTWIPFYQRGRVTNRRKISKLINIFKNNQPIDSIKLNFIGSCEGNTKELVLDGKFHVIDGQQRLYALVDSQVEGVRIPVELYINAPIEEEIRLFHQFNKDSTRLSFGDLAKSARGPGGDMVRKWLKDDGRSWPIKIVTQNAKEGLTLSTVCPIFHWSFDLGFLP